MTDWSKAKNILCIRLDAMGDLLMTTPGIQALKEAVPGREITLLTSSQGAQIARSIPLFKKIITYQAPWLKATPQREDAEIDFEMINLLKAHAFDGVVIFTVYSQNPLPSALMCYLAGIPLRAAFCRENPYQLLTNWIKEEEPEIKLRHEVRRHIELVETLGAKGENQPLTLMATQEAIGSLEVKLKLRDISLDDPALIIIHPGSTAESRRYHASGFAELADRLIAESHKKILFTGGPDEKGLIESIQGQMKGTSLNLGGALSLEEMIALVAHVPLLISNNSGPIHMAAALGTPVVVLYALTNPQHTPWMVPHHVLFNDVDCRYCYKSICPNGTNACLNLIPPERIYDSAINLLSRNFLNKYDQQAVNPLEYKG